MYYANEMGILSLIVLVLSFCCFYCGYHAQHNDDKNVSGHQESLKLLIERIKLLEHKNEETESKIAYMNATFQEKEILLTARINDLETQNSITKEICREFISQESHHDKRQDRQSTFIARLGLNDTLRSKGKEETDDVIRSETRIRRSAGRSEIAFFATVTPHDMRNLGANQVIVFDNAQVNIGDAYNEMIGFFVAPVDGTYVFATTIAGWSPPGYFYAHIDINGQVAAKMLFASGNLTQTAQTVVLQLQSGDAVAVKNDMLKDYVLGDRYSTFSGFLLFEHQVSTQLVGK